MAASVVTVAAVAALWVVDATWAVRVGVTALAVLGLLGVWMSAHAASTTTTRLFEEAQARRVELGQLRGELIELRRQHLEVMTELRDMRLELVALAREATQIARDDADQRALIHDLLTPTEPARDPIYPSLQLPLVRAAFSEELPAAPIATPRPEVADTVQESTTGFEPAAPRQLLDLTAAEIARLRPAN